MPRLFPLRIDILWSFFLELFNSKERMLTYSQTDIYNVKELSISINIFCLELVLWLVMTLKIPNTWKRRWMIPLGSWLPLEYHPDESLLLITKFWTKQTTAATFTSGDTWVYKPNWNRIVYLWLSPSTAYAIWIHCSNQVSVLIFYWKMILYLS